MSKKLTRAELIQMLKVIGINNHSKTKLEDLVAICKENGLLEDEQAKPEVNVASLEEEAAKFISVSRDKKVVSRDYNPEEEFKKQLGLEEEAITEPEPIPAVEEAEEKKGGSMSKFTLITGQEVNASEQEEYDGQIAKLIRVGDHTYDIEWVDGKVPIGKTAAVRKQAADSGKFKLVRVQYHDPEWRALAIRLCVDRLREAGMRKYGRPLYPIFWHTDTKDAKGLVGFKEDFDNLLGVDIFTHGKGKKSASDWIGYDTPARISITGSTKDKLKFLVLDVEGPNGEAYWDGQGYLNAELTYQSYLSDKDIAEGKRSKTKKDDTVQFRAFIPSFMKGQMSMNWRYVHDACLSFGITNWEDYDGVVSFDAMKTNPLGLKHGDSFEVNATDLSVVNRITDAPVSSAGIQLVTHKPAVVAALADELDVASHGFILRDVLNGNLEAAHEMLMSAKVKSMEDSDVAPAMFIGMSVPDEKRKGEYRVPMWATNANRYGARALRYYQSDLLKMVTSNMAVYAVACPVLIKDANGNLRDALSYYERKHLAITGEAKTFIVLPSDDAAIREYASKKFRNIERHPLVGIGSVQSTEPLLKDYVNEIRSMGFKSISLRKVDGELYAVHPCKHGVMASYDLMKAMNGDYDGDMLYFILSDRADFGFARVPKSTVVTEEDGGDRITSFDHEIYPKFLKYKYQMVINSQSLIGLTDLLVRRIIEENRLNKHGLTSDQYMELAIERESMIQGRKHLSEDMDLDNPPTVDEQFSAMRSRLVKRYHWKKFMVLKGTAAPVTHKLKVFGASGTGIRTESSITAVNNIIRLVHELEHQPNAKNDAYYQAWVNARGASFEVNNHDSGYWANKFNALWVKLQKGDKEMLGVEVSAKRLMTVASFCKFLVKGGIGWKGYSVISTELLAIKDENFRRNEFFRLSKACDAKIARFIEEQVGFDEVKIDLLKKLMTIYFGKIGFGTWTTREGDVKGFGGACFWRMKNKYILWAAKLVHPDNAAIDRLLDTLKIKL